MEHLASQQDDLKSINLTACWELNDQTIIQLLTKFKRKAILSNIYNFMVQKDG
jgi:hypothetical protein